MLDRLKYRFKISGLELDSPSFLEKIPNEGLKEEFTAGKVLRTLDWLKLKQKGEMTDGFVCLDYLTVLNSKLPISIPFL